MWLTLFVLGCSSPESVPAAPAAAPAHAEPHWVARSDAQLADALKAICQASLADGEPVLVEFSAPWCLDCKALQKLEANAPLAAEYERWHRVRVDVGRFDRHPVLLEAFQVRAIAHWVALRPTDCAAPVQDWPRIDARLVEIDSGAARAEGPQGLLTWLAQQRTR